MRPELVIVNDKVMAVRLGGQEFPCEPETVEAIIPKKALTGFKLSEVPEELRIKPVESIADGRIEIKNDIGLSSFAGGPDIQKPRRSGNTPASGFLDLWRQNGADST